MERIRADLRRSNQLCCLLSTLLQPASPAIVARFRGVLDSRRNSCNETTTARPATHRNLEKPATRNGQATTVPSCPEVSGNVPVRALPAGLTNLSSSPNALSIPQSMPVISQGSVCVAAATAGSRAQALRALIKRCVSLARKLGLGGKVHLMPAGFPGTTILLARNSEGWSVDISCPDTLSARAFSGAGPILGRQFAKAGLGEVRLAVR